MPEGLARSMLAYGKDGWRGRSLRADRQGRGELALLHGEAGRDVGQRRRRDQPLVRPASAGASPRAIGGDASSDAVR